MIFLNVAGSQWIVVKLNLSPWYVQVHRFHKTYKRNNIIFLHWFSPYLILRADLFLLGINWRHVAILHLLVYAALRVISRAFFTALLHFIHNINFNNIKAERKPCARERQTIFKVTLLTDYRTDKMKSIIVSQSRNKFFFIII